MSDLKLLFKLMLASILILLVFPYIGSASAIDEVSPDDARVKLAEAFEAVLEAERIGGDVSNLVAELNEAMTLLKEGEAYGNETLIREAVLKAEAVIAEAPALGQEGAASARIHMIQSGVVLGLVAVLAVIVWRYGPRVFWRLWVRSKSDWRVKAANR